MRYKYVKQHDITDCAAACLAMICLHYKKEATITSLRDMMGTDLKGTNLIGLSKCASKLGLENKAVRADREGLFSKFTLPCIANVITKEGLSHFVVIYKIKKKYIVVADPATGIEKQTVETFFKQFTGALLILKPTTEFHTGKVEGEKTFSRFLRLLLPQKRLFLFAILASLVMTILGIVSSLFNKIIMDEVLPYGLEKLLLASLIIFAIVGITQILVGFLRNWIMLYLSQRIDIPLMLGYFKHIYSLPMRFFATRKTGDIITRFSDAFTIKDVFTNIALTLIMDITMALITGVILAKMNFSLFAIVLLLTIISIVLIFIFKQPYKKINQEQMQQSSILNSQIIEGLEGVETIKSNASEKKELDNIEKEYIRSLRIAFKEGWLSNIQGSISALIETIGNLFIMYFGIKQVLNGEITLGTLMAFMTLTGYFMDPVGRFVGMQLDIQEANISMKRIAEILDYKMEDEGGYKQELDTFQGNIEIESLTFRYGNRNPVLKNISFKVSPGAKVAIVGESGSGKSTIAKLLLKYYRPEEGKIKIDGLDIEEVSSESLRRNIAYVPQKIELFSKSIYENIAITKPDATEKEIKEAARLANAIEFIKKQPLQFYTYLEEAGGGLSGGERQRIALARAFLKNSNIYILDESTSSLDFATENVIFDMIYNKLKSKTMIIIAHRLSTIKNCDKIILLHEGQVAEEGSHAELLEKRGMYYRLWEMQQGNLLDIDASNDSEGAENLKLHIDSEIRESTDRDEMLYR